MKQTISQSIRADGQPGANMEALSPDTVITAPANEAMQVDFAIINMLNEEQRRPDQTAYMLIGTVC